MGKGKKKSTPKTPEQQKAARLMAAKKQGKRIQEQIKPVVKEQLEDMIPSETAKFVGKVVDEAIEDPMGFTAKVVHKGKKVLNTIKRGGFIAGGYLSGLPMFKGDVRRTIKCLDDMAVERETAKRVNSQLEEWKKAQPVTDEPRDEWERKLEREAKEKKKQLHKQIKEEVRQQVREKAGTVTYNDATQKHFEQFQEKEKVQRPKRIRKEVEALALDHTDDLVRDWMGIDPKKNPRESLLYDYAGGTQITKFLQNINEVKDNDTQGWRKLKDVDWGKGAGAAAEVIGNLDKEKEGSKWSPLIGAGIGAAKKFLNVTNPWWGLAMDVGGILASTSVGRNAVSWVGDKAMGLGRAVIDKVKNRNLSRMHNDGVIPVLPKKEEPVVQKPIDYSGVNIPNILPQESNAEYMMRMTGGMNVGPANANVVTYSGYKKPQYEKVQNRVMLAPPRISSKRGKVRVRRRR